MNGYIDGIGNSKKRSGRTEHGEYAAHLNKKRGCCKESGANKKIEKWIHDAHQFKPEDKEIDISRRR